MDRPHAVLSARRRLPRRHFLRTARLNAVGFRAGTATGFSFTDDAAVTRAVADQLNASAPLL